MVQDGATTGPKYHSGDFRWLCSAHHSCGAREREKTKRKGEDRWNPWLKVLKARLWGHTACSRCVCVKYKKAFPLWSQLLRQAVIFPLCFSTHRLPRPAPPTEVRTTLLLRDNISAFPYSSSSSSSSPLSQSVCVFIHLHHHHCLFLHLHLRLWLRFLLTLLSLHSFVQVFTHFAPRKRNEPATTPGSSLSYFLHPHFRSPTSQRR